jgi:hypothetical protein
VNLILGEILDDFDMGLWKTHVGPRFPYSTENIVEFAARLRCHQVRFLLLMSWSDKHADFIHLRCPGDVVQKLQ